MIDIGETCKLSLSAHFLSEGHTTQQPTVAVVPALTERNVYRWFNGELDDSQCDDHLPVEKTDVSSLAKFVFIGSFLIEPFL
jgi:hypothetical protein